MRHRFLPSIVGLAVGRKSSLTILTFILFCSGATAASGGTVKGIVSDSEGAAIEGAHLVFHLDPSGGAKSAPAPDVVRETDVMGRFSVQLEPAFYDVCVMATAFTPQCSKILVPKEGDIRHDARLKADPLVTRHLGDRF